MNARLQMTQAEYPYPLMTVDEFLGMLQGDPLSPEVRVELIEGVIVVKPRPMDPVHASLISRLNRRLTYAVGDVAHVRPQLPVHLGDYTFLMPDVIVAKRRADDYWKAEPMAGDVLLAIEVSNTTFKRDFRRKVPLYAQHGVPEVWLVDVQERQIHYFKDNGGEHYADHGMTKGPGVWRLAALPDVKVDLSELMEP